MMFGLIFVGPVGVLEAKRFSRNREREHWPSCEQDLASDQRLLE